MRLSLRQIGKSRIIWVFWLCLVVLCRSGLASDVPFVFDEETSDLASYSTVQLEEASTSSPDLVGVPSVTSPPDKEVLEIPVTGGGSTSEGKLEREAIDLKDELNKKVEPDNPSIRGVAAILASKSPGDLNADQICEIYIYLKFGDRAKNGWRYVRDPRGIDSWNYANESLKIGDKANCVGLGDCDDFAILMAAFIESIGGTTRIVLANNNSIGGHAYTEVYLGQLNNPNNKVEKVIGCLQQEYGIGKIYGHVDTDTKEVWLNLDWGPDEKGNAHPGGPLFQGDKHYVLSIRDEYGRIPVGICNGINRAPRLISLTPDRDNLLEAGSLVTWTAKASDPDNDQIRYRFILNGFPVTNWINDNLWIWTTTDADIGDNKIEVCIIDGKHSGPNGFDSNKAANFSVIESKGEQNVTPNSIHIDVLKREPRENPSTECNKIDCMDDNSSWKPLNYGASQKVVLTNKSNDKAIRIDYDLNEQRDYCGIYKDISPEELKGTTAIKLLYNTSKDIKIIEIKLEDTDISDRFVKSFGEKSRIDESGILVVQYNDTKCISSKGACSNNNFSIDRIKRITIVVTKKAGPVKGWLIIRELQGCNIT